MVVDSTASTVPLSRTARDEVLPRDRRRRLPSAGLSEFGIPRIAPAHERGARRHADQHDRGGYPQARVALGRHRCSGYQTALSRYWLASFRVRHRRGRDDRAQSCHLPRPVSRTTFRTWGTVPGRQLNLRLCPPPQNTPPGAGVQTVVGTGAGLDIVREVRAEPLLDILQTHPLAAGVRLDLIAAEAADIEVLGLGMREVQPADARRGQHGGAVGQRNPLLRGVQQAEQLELLAVIRAGRIPVGRPDPAEFLANHVLERQLLALAVSPVLTRLRVQILGGRLRQTVGQRLDHDRVVVVQILARTAGPARRRRYRP